MDILRRIEAYWNKASCGTEFIKEEKFSADYFKEIENFRYSHEPEIFSFAQFTRFHKKKVLEVGIGAGTDFTQWVRAGAYAYGIDLTQEALENTKRRLALEHLQAEELLQANAQEIPYPDNTFDLTYSWGVIHHAPKPEKCLEEIIRVTKPNGTIKIMVYNRHSLFAFYRYLLCAFFKGKPFTSLKKVLYYHQESIGTQAYTRKEIKNILEKLPVRIKSITTTLTNHELLYYKSKPWHYLAYICAFLTGWHKRGWFMMLELEKIG